MNTSLAKNNHHCLFICYFRENISPRQIIIQRYASSHFKALEKIFPTVLKFLIFLNVTRESTHLNYDVKSDFFSKGRTKILLKSILRLFSFEPKKTSLVEVVKGEG